MLRPVLGPGAYAVTSTTLRTPITARPSVHVAGTPFSKAIDVASGRVYGSKPLTAFYVGLTDRMKQMGALHLPISVVA